MKHVSLFARISIVLVLLAAFAAYGPAGQPDKEGSNSAEQLNAARDASSSLKTALKFKLMAEMASGGPVSAITVCNEVAPTLAAEHSVDGLVIRRVSLKNRNTLNAPDAYERAKLIEFENLHKAGELPDDVYEVIDTDGKQVFRYLQPILVKGICLKCHGDPAAMDPDVKRMVQEKYPEDSATGYTAGELRGAISVQIDL
jgi:hypothetical protein